MMKFWADGFWARGFWADNTWLGLIFGGERGRRVSPWGERSAR